MGAWARALRGCPGVPIPVPRCTVCNVGLRMCALIVLYYYYCYSTTLRKGDQYCHSTFSFYILHSIETNYIRSVPQVLRSFPRSFATSRDSGIVTGVAQCERGRLKSEILQVYLWLVAAAS